MIIDHKYTVESICFVLTQIKAMVVISCNDFASLILVEHKMSKDPNFIYSFNLAYFERESTNLFK